MQKNLFYLIITILLGCSVNFTYGQQPIIDSLKTELSQATEDTTKLNILKELFWQYRRTHPDSSMKYARQSLQLSLAIGDKRRQASVYRRIGIIHKFYANHDSAIHYFNRSLINFELLNDDEGIGGAYIEMGTIYKNQNNYQKALEYFNQALQIFTANENITHLARIYNILGTIYYSQKQYDKALEYHNKSYALNSEKGFELGISVNLNNIGIVYIELKEYEKAIGTYLQSLKIKEKIDDKVGVSNVKLNLGMAYIKTGKNEKAIEFLDAALGGFKQSGDKQSESLCYVNLGKVYHNLGDFKTAIRFSEKAFELANKLNYKNSIKEACHNLAKTYAAINQFKMAYKYQELYNKYSDSLSSEEIVSTITKMESKFAIEKKEKEIALLNSENEKQELEVNQQRTQRNLMIGITMMIVLALFFLYWGYRNKIRLNQKLRNLNKTQSRFFANISHDFRTPLTLLLGPLEKLMENPIQEEQEMIGMMHRNASRLLILNMQLMDLSKLEAGRLNMKVSHSNLIHAIKGIVLSFQSLAEKKDINFRCEFPDGDIMAWFDQDKLEKIIYNLLSNAIKFTPDFGEVNFKLFLVSENEKNKFSAQTKKIHGQIMCISVGDTGPGITKKHLPLIFDRFYQVDSRLRRNYEGTGIGLSLTKELIELYRGDLQIETQKGKGSTFNVYLPIEKNAFNAADIIETTEISYKPSAFLSSIQAENRSYGPDIEEEITSDELKEMQKILIVEDNKDMRGYISDCFTGNYKIAEAIDGKEGFETAIKNDPDIIITDLMMPNMDGLQMCEKLKTDERTSHIPIILLTALASVNDRVKGLETGADDYIAKPFNRQELTVRVQNLIEQRKLLRERFAKEIKIQPKDIAVVSADEKFLNKLITFVEDNITEAELNVDSLTNQVHFSRSQLHRKLKALTNMSATEFIRTIRLKRAAQLLAQKHGNIAETAYDVGFNDVSYFSKCFQKQFGVNPTAYQKSTS